MTSLPVHISPWKPSTSTRLLRRKSSARGWILGVLVTLLVNGGLILVLAQISHVEHYVPTRLPEVVRHITHVPPPPLEQPLETSVEQAPVVPVPIHTPTPLPALDLPPLAGDPGMALPDLGVTATVSLPWSLPSFHAISTASPNPAVGPGLVDVAPELAESFDLERFYPALARLHHVEGESQVRIAVNAEGQVTSCTIIRSTPAGVFERAVNQLVMSLHYHPAMRAGVAVSSLVNLTISWTLR